MYRLLFIPLCVAACTPLGGPAFWPAAGSGATTEIMAGRQSAVETFFKTNHPALIAEIMTGGGGTVDQAMDLAGIPMQDRPTRLIQLRSDAQFYQSAPGALVAALMLYGR